MRTSICIFLLIAQLISGCASGVGPTNRDEFRRELADALRIQERDIEFAQSGEWSDLYGYRDYFLNSSREVVRRGVVVQTSEQIAFAVWMSSHRYSPAWIHPYSDIREVTVDTYGRAKRIVINLADGDFRTFTITNRGMIDREAVSKVAETIRQHIQRESR